MTKKQMKFTDELADEWEKFAYLDWPPEDRDYSKETVINMCRAAFKDGADEILKHFKIKC